MKETLKNLFPELQTKGVKFDYKFYKGEKKLYIDAYIKDENERFGYTKKEICRIAGETMTEIIRDLKLKQLGI